MDPGMSDTGEQGMNPKDPAQRAGIGGGVVPDDQTEGQEQAAQAPEHPHDEEAGEPPRPR
jgi:hypothetical protein